MRRIGHAFLGVLLVLASFGSAWAAPAQALEGLVNLRFELDARVFAVLAAASAGGLDLGRAEGPAAVAREEAGRRLAGLDAELRSRLREFCGLRGALQSEYVSFALFLEGPPAFTLRVAVEALPPDVQALAGFERLVAEVWRTAPLGAAWEALRPEYVRFVEGYRPAIRALMVEILAYMRTEARVALDRQVTFVPDLLNGAGVVNARNVAEHYLLLVGSEVGGRRPLGAVRHELLHFMIDPLMRKYEAHLPEAEPFLASVRRLAAPRPGYDRDLPLVAVESLIGAIELRLGRDAGRDDRTAVSARFKQGLVLVPYFLEVLERFEGGSGSLQEAFPDLVRGIEWRAEKGRADAIARLDAELAAGGAAGAAAGDGAAARRARLSRANSLLQARDFAAARPVLEEILRESPEDPNALFGLAQIASQGDQLDAALDLYGRAAQHAGRESWIAGWSGVRRGSILEFRGDAAAARAEWERVLALAGDLRGSREAAARALEKLAGDRRSPR